MAEASVPVRYNGVSPAYAAELQKWINQNNKFNEYTFDEAYIPDINLHSTTSTADPNERDHVTVRMSTVALREKQEWYTVHWRPNEGGVYLPNPDSQASKDKKKEKRDAKKAKKNKT